MADLVGQTSRVLHTSSKLPVFGVFSPSLAAVPLSDVLVQRFQRVELVVLAEEAGEVGGVGVHGVGVGQFDVRREERVGRETERAQQTAGGGK
jgi:hypothetical protein